MPFKELRLHESEGRGDREIGYKSPERRREQYEATDYESNRWGDSTLTKTPFDFRGTSSARGEVISEHQERPSMEQGGSSSGGGAWVERAASDLAYYVDQMYIRIGEGNKWKIEEMINSEGTIVHEDVKQEYDAFVKICDDWEPQSNSEHQHGEQTKRQGQIEALAEHALKNDISLHLQNGRGTSLEQHMYKNKLTELEYQNFLGSDYYKNLDTKQQMRINNVFRKGRSFRQS